MGLVIFSCTKLEEPVAGTSNKVEISTANPVTKIGADSAFAGGTITKDGGETISERGIVWATSSNPTVNNFKRNAGSGTGNYLIEIDTLLPFTDYFVRAYAINYFGTFYGQQVAFKTIKGVPKFNSSNVVSFEAYLAKVSAFIVLDGGDPVSNRGFCFSKNPNPSLVNGTVIQAGKGTLYYEATLLNLLPNQKYYVRPYATNNIGTAYGKQVEFTTSVGPAKMGNIQVSSITSTSARFDASILSAEGGNLSRRGFVISKNPDPYLYNGTVIEQGNGIGSFAYTIQNLEKSTRYYVKAFAVNESGVSHSSQVMFTTLGLPGVSTNTNATNVGYTNFFVSGIVNSDGGSPILERGFCLNTSGNPNVNENRIRVDGQLGGFQTEYNGLRDGTTHYYRAYAINEVGVAYGNVVSVSTLAKVLPGVSTNTNATNVGYTNFFVSGIVNSDGGSPILERGFCLNTSGNPNVNENRIRVDGQLGGFQTEYNGLRDGTTHYYRAYAINEVGVAYGNVVSVSTRANTQPVITRTPALGSVSNRQINLTGYLDSDGGLQITDRGFLYSRSTSNPSFNDSRLQLSGGNEWSGTISNLINGNVTYYVRSYAVNSLGAALGPVSSFATPNITIPIVRNGSASGIAARTATISGIVDSDGNGNITNTNFLLSTNSNMAGALSYTGFGYSNSNKTFSTSFTGLSPNSTYYYQARASNEAGYANLPSASSFKTLCEPATFSFPGIISKTTTTLRVNFSVNSIGDSGPIEIGLCYSRLNSNPQIGGSNVSTLLIYSNSGISSGSFAGTITGLTRATPYYVQAYVKSCYGTTYSGVAYTATSN